MTFLVRLSELDFEISMLLLSTLIGLPLDTISKCANILSKATEPKVSFVHFFIVCCTLCLFYKKKYFNLQRSAYMAAYRTSLQKFISGGTTYLIIKVYL